MASSSSSAEELSRNDPKSSESPHIICDASCRSTLTPLPTDQSLACPLPPIAPGDRRMSLDLNTFLTTTKLEKGDGDCNANLLLPSCLCDEDGGLSIFSGDGKNSGRDEGFVV